MSSDDTHARLRKELEEVIESFETQIAVATANLVIQLQRDYVLQHVRANLGEAVGREVARAFDAYLEYEHREGERFEARQNQKAD